MKTKKARMLLGVLMVALVAWTISSCSKSDSTPAAVKTNLNDSIAAALLLVNSAPEGIEDGQFAVGSKVTLAIAIGEAESIANGSGESQQIVNSTLASLAAAMTTFSAGKVVPVAVEALIGHWGFDEGTGATANDATANAFNGTLKAGPTQWGAKMPTWTADRKGNSNKALQFNNGASVEVPYNTKLNPASLTIAVWVRTDSIRAPNRFIGLQSWLGYKFELDDTNRPFASIQTVTGANDRNDQHALPANEWFHLVVTYVDGTETFYVNGTSVLTWTDFNGPALPISAKPYNLVIGADFPVDKYSSDANGTNFGNAASADYHVIPLAWGGHFSGAIDEMRIYSTALSASQVTSVYDREK